MWFNEGSMMKYIAIKYTIDSIIMIQGNISRLIDRINQYTSYCSRMMSYGIGRGRTALFHQCYIIYCYARNCKLIISGLNFHIKYEKW